MSLFDELKRRNVFRVTIGYIVSTWLLLQVADLVLENIGAPDWIIQSIMLVIALGFPVVVFFSWAYEVTPNGIKRESEIDRSQSITHVTGRKLDYSILAVLILALGYFVWESRFSGRTPELSEPQNAESVVQDHATAPGVTPPETLAVDNLSIAVLPFANRSRNEDDEFFTEGIHDDLLTQLAKINDLKVVSRTTAMKYKNTALSIPEIAAELGVSTILEGGVQRAGDRVRINAQLINVNTDEHLWAETYDREMTVANLFEIQTEITQQIVMAVRGELTTEEAAALSGVPTESLEAYEAYLMARSVMRSEAYSLDRYTKAFPWTEKALAHDPEFSWAWAQLAGNLGMQVWLGADNSEEKISTMLDAIDQAKRYGPGQPVVLLAQGEYSYRIDNDYPMASRAFEKVVKLRPGDAEAWNSLGLALRRTNRLEEAVAAFDRSIALNPDDSTTRHNLLETLLYMKRFSEAESLARQFLEKFPNHHDLKSALVDALIKTGDLAKAQSVLGQSQPEYDNPRYPTYITISVYERDFQKLEVFLEGLEKFEEDNHSSAAFWGERGRVAQALGREDEATVYLRQCLELDESVISVTDARRSMDFYNRAWSHVMMGEFEAAEDLILKAEILMPRDRDRYHWSDYAWLKPFVFAKTGRRKEALDILKVLVNGPSHITAWNLHYAPSWDFFRDDPRFVALATPVDLEANE